MKSIIFLSVFLLSSSLFAADDKTFEVGDRVTIKYNKNVSTKTVSVFKRGNLNVGAIIPEKGKAHVGAGYVAGFGADSSTTSKIKPDPAFEAAMKIDELNALQTNSRPDTINITQVDLGEITDPEKTQAFKALLLNGADPEEARRIIKAQTR